jgi:hypothetical protein
LDSAKKNFVVSRRVFWRTAAGAAHRRPAWRWASVF